MRPQNSTVVYTYQHYRDQYGSDDLDVASGVHLSVLKTGTLEGVLVENEMLQKEDNID